MENMFYSQIQKGTLLIAAPDVETGFFFRSVILICEHSSNGSFGLVINKSLELELPEEIIDIQNLTNPLVSIRAGGPVQTNQMMLLHADPQIPSQTLQISEGIYLGGDLLFLQKALTDPNGPPVHLYFGYAGWGAGQLEREFLDGSWFLHPGSTKYLFHTKTEDIWPSLLRDMGGKYASLSMIPEDLSLN